jgi:hypothetical protein
MQATSLIRLYNEPLGETIIMSIGFWPIAAFILFVFVWVLSKVFFYARKSEEQWQKVDKSKLKEWDDDEE